MHVKTRFIILPGRFSNLPEGIRRFSAWKALTWSQITHLNRSMKVPATPNDLACHCFCWVKSLGTEVTGTTLHALWQVYDLHVYRTCQFFFLNCDLFSRSLVILVSVLRLERYFGTGNSLLVTLIVDKRQTGAWGAKFDISCKMSGVLSLLRTQVLWFLHAVKLLLGKSYQDNSCNALALHTWGFKLVQFCMKAP